jgi:hypothetical protein
MLNEFERTPAETMILFAPQVLLGQTIALAHGPPEVHDSRKRYFLIQKYAALRLLQKLLKISGFRLRQL